MKKLVICIVLAPISLTIWASPQTVSLDLPTMNCSMCPITVEKVLKKVEGVIEADASYKKKQAVVTFDDAKTSADELIKATTNAGYPSSIVKM